MLVDLLELNRHLCCKVDQVTQVTQRVLNRNKRGTVSWIRGQNLSPRLGDMVDSATLCSLAGRYDNPLPESTISPSQRLRIWLVDLLKLNRHLCGKVDQVTQVTQRVLDSGGQTP